MSSAKIFHRLVTVEEALKLLEGFSRSLRPAIEEVDLSEARGRVLADDVLALADYPPFDRSEVDGYAVRSADTVGADEDRPVKLRVLESVGVGVKPEHTVEPGTCIEVATGSMVPRGADAVIPVEYTRRMGDSVYVYRPAAPGDNIAHGGHDVLSGDVVVSEGTLIGPEELVVLAGSGVSKVKVYSRMRACIFSIGNELVEPGKRLELGMVYDVNEYYLKAALEELGVIVSTYGILRDDESTVVEALSKAMVECDIVVTSGGTSAGVGDVTYRAVERLGKPGLLFHGLKVRPGKPTFVAAVNGKLLIGLPGFPLSMMMIYNILVKPLVAKMLGLREGYLSYYEEAVLSERVLGHVGVERLVPVVLRRKRGGLVAYPLSYRSGSVNILQLADGFIKVGMGVPFIDSGSPVTVFRLHNRRVADLVVVGSHDYLFNAILRHVSREFQVKSVYAGSLAGLDAVAKGIADLAGTHVLDKDTGTYNVPIIRRLGYGKRIALIAGYLREIGLVVPKGNPKKISGLSDLLREDVVFINRSRYSGTRVLIDLMLEKIAEEKGIPFDELISRIKGYYSEAKTHSGVAISVLNGRADVGVSLRYVAIKYGLDFLPLAYEKFDMAVSLESLDTKEVRKVIEFMKSRELKEMLVDYPGYKLLDNTGELIFLE
jgi:putative molybdopterin biosynthesis protein